MSSFTIQVLNNSRNNQVYSLFYRPFPASGYSPLACVTQKSATIANNYTATFTIDLPTAVVCGTSPNQPLGSGVNVSIQESTVITPPEVSLLPPPTQDTTAVGNWARIVTQNYNTNPAAHVFCGLGVVSPGSGQIVPSCVWEVQPNTPYAILNPPQQPVFYVSSDSSLNVGTITAATSKDATVDFTDTGDNFCMVTQMSDDTFKVAPTSDVKS
ncbi:uncharacterized protein P174DRAFT_421896 [Aspergillus novofumigatus IBT 16806]|uniref:Uncharacterized protein n=1 Tax=Aspergillus novofumigatus (strain IBT 16806) TaxID=1392255 RepID=A0A2I1C5H8_ASPN1|nr:uncharacterized protein P174DRAFT_421896 [Aspergillus novofumigatus IBT 16806]PKX92866.1 hypothetical protein P174DRAFT_421896 [Aspergillus novofumigatus IBT 16806]